MKKERDNTIDIAKGIAIILMCIGHSYCPEQLCTFIYLFHMPFFFMISGWFWKEKNVEHPINYITKKIKTLWIPFVAMGEAVRKP